MFTPKKNSVTNISMWSACRRGISNM